MDNIKKIIIFILLITPFTLYGETLKFFSWQKTESGISDWWKAAITEFENENPDIKIDFTQLGRKAYADTFATMFASGSPPDIVHLAAFEYQQFADQGFMEPLDKWIKKSNLDLTGWGGQKTCQWKDTTYCIMLFYFGDVMGINQNLFNKENIAIPKNFDEYLAAARKLTKDTDGDGIIDQWGIGTQTTGGNNYTNRVIAYVLDAGGYWTDSEGKIAVKMPGVVEGIRRWKMIQKEGLTPLDLESGGIRQLFIEGRIAMLMDGPWIWGIMQKAQPQIKKHLRLVKPPIYPPRGGTSNAIGMASEISETKKEMVWKFISHIASKKWQGKLATIAGNIPPRPGVIPKEAYESNKNFKLMEYTTVAAADAGVDRLPKGLETTFNEFAKIVFEELQRMMIDDLSAEVAADNIHQRAIKLQ